MTCLVGLDWKKENKETYKQVDKPQVGVMGQIPQPPGSLPGVMGPGPGPVEEGVMKVLRAEQAPKVPLSSLSPVHYVQPRRGRKWNPDNTPPN